MEKYTISCKKCKHSERVGRWIFCKEGNGTFLHTVKFQECNDYKSIKDCNKVGQTPKGENK